MNTRIIMTASALVMGVTGAVLTFLPDEVASYMNWDGRSSIVLQILGALYFGFAMTNWMSRGNLIGGIYNRPLAIGNFSHFFITALALLKFSMKGSTTSMIMVATAVYAVFAIAFGYIFVTHPLKESKAE